MFGAEGRHIQHELVVQLRKLLEAELDTSIEKTEIDLWLDSDGGNLQATYKLVLLLQSKCRTLRIVVPEWAKSAATLLAIAGDELYMGADAELGPLDPQIRHPDRDDCKVSAKDVSQAAEYLLKISLETAIRCATWLYDLEAYSKDDAFRVASEFTSKLTAPMLSKLDPVLMNRARSELLAVEDYCNQIMDKKIGKLGDKYPPEKKKLLRKLPKRLLAFNTHSFVIGRELTEKMGLEIRRLRDYKYRTELVKFADCANSNGKAVLEVKKCAGVLN